MILGIARGRVQGVGFRWHVRRAALSVGVTGYAKNLADGSVEVLLCGDEQSIEMVKVAVQSGPAGSRVDEVGWEKVDRYVDSGFQVL